MQYLVILFFFGLATGVVAKIKGSSLLIWFLIGFCLPVIGLVAALLYRWERDEPTRLCNRCGARLMLYDQVCKVCGEDLKMPEGV